jgi:hypothetical protein
MARPIVYRTDQASIGVTVAGIALPEGSWDVLEGAENMVEGVSVLPGGMAPQRALGGIPKRGPATVKRLWSEPLVLVFKQLDALAGYGDITITYTVLNRNKTATIFTDTYTGVMGTVSRPNYEAKTSEPAYLTIEAELDGELS